MQSSNFDAVGTTKVHFSANRFPTSLPGRVVCVSFSTCYPNELKCWVVDCVEDAGVPLDAWWCIESTGLPNRYVRLFNGMASLKRFVLYYGFLDKNGCVNCESGYIEIDTNTGPRSCKRFDMCTIKQGDVDVRGVPQRLKNSGICWFASMCFASMFSLQLRKVITASLPPHVVREFENCLYDAEAAERLRQLLYYEYHLGDDPQQHPSLDGQNGFSQLCILLAKHNIPTIRIFAPSMNEIMSPVVDKQGNAYQMRSRAKLDEPIILVVRCFRTHWNPSRRITYAGRRFKLVSVMIGSEHCGHQIAASTRDLHINKWAFQDADGGFYGIGPQFWDMCKPSDNRGRVPKNIPRQTWLSIWENVLPLSVITDDRKCTFCPLNFGASNALGTRSAAAYEVGLVNSDFIYLSL